MRDSTHDALIRHEFTKQAQAYATNPTITDRAWAERLVDSVKPRRDARVLEVATGPGYVALAFAAVTDEVVGIDLTEAPLAIARENRDQRDLSNVTFQTGDAKALPFPDDSFDVVVCRLAFHHFESPAVVLSEMVRVCWPRGTVAVEDLIASERPERAEVYNHWERLRAPSHVAALSPSQFLTLLRDADVEIERLRWEERAQPVERWLSTTKTSGETAETIRRLIREDSSGHLSGTAITEDEEGRLGFMHRVVTLVGRTPLA
jgi:ubiquinone/menaquinone biosynthesis C-methylase UbiE